MKTNILTTVAAALIAGVGCLTLATGASANHEHSKPKKLKLSGLCTKVNGGLINAHHTPSASALLPAFCKVHTVWAKNRQLRFWFEGYAEFTKYKGVLSTPANIKKCTKSVMILHYYKRTLPGKWQLVYKVKRTAVKKFNKCVAFTVTPYITGAKMYMVIIRVVDGDGNNTGNNLIRTKFFT